MTHQPPQEPGQPGYPPYQQGLQTWLQQGQPYPQQQFAPYGQPPGPPPRPLRRRPRGPWYRRPGVLSAIGAVVVLVIIGSVTNSGHKQSPAAAVAAATSAPATSAAASASARSTASAAPETITYIVKGTPDADVTYGAAGSSYQGAVPMRITRRARDVSYYSIQAQLQGSGSVTVEIEINGKVISSGHASGGYNIAMAEISKDPFSGEWQDTQG